MKTKVEMTRDTLVRRIREKMDADSLTPEVAARVIVHEIVQADETQDLLMAIIVPYLAGAAVRKTNKSRPKGGSTKKAQKDRENWLDHLRANPEDLWNLMVPVPGTTEPKRLGDFTTADVQRTEQFYRGEANRMQTVAERWHRIHRRMTPFQTLEEAVAEGRLDIDTINNVGVDLDVEDED